MNKRIEYQKSWRDRNIIKVRKQALDYVNRKRAEDREGFLKKACENAKRWRQNHLEECRVKEREKSRRHRAKNIDAYNLQQREYRKNNPEKFKVYSEKYKPRMKKYSRIKTIEKYGISLEDYNQMLLAQKGKCALCDKTFSGQINIDHNHETGKVRSLLCTHCNTSLGYIEKCIIIQPDILKKITEYLKTHSN